MRDISLFPPTCCGVPISIIYDDVRAALGEPLATEFRDKAAEWEAANRRARVHCINPWCSARIPPQNIVPGSDVGICPRCRATTCTICKAAAHPGTDCPEDEGTRNLLRLAGQERWRQCYRCRRIVEFNGGCYHISTSFSS